MAEAQTVVRTFQKGDRVKYYDGRAGKVVSISEGLARVKDDATGIVWRLPMEDLSAEQIS